MAIESSINIILGYMCDTIEALEPLSYKNIRYQRYALPIPFSEVNLTLNYRAFQFYLEDGGNSNSPGAISGRSYIAMRENLVLSVLYGLELTEVFGADKQGILSMIYEDRSQLLATMKSPTLFGALTGHTVMRAPFLGARGFTNAAGFRVSELVFDFRWRQRIV